MENLLKRVGLVALSLAIVAAAVVLATWGTRWTVPQARSAAAGYTLVATWNGSHVPGGRLRRPIGIARSPSGDLYVTDARQRVIRFSPEGAFRGQWGRQGDRPGEFSNAVGVAVAREGAVYVSDYEQDRIQQFDAEGKFVRQFGSSGSNPGEFDAPAALAIDETGFIYVADFYNHRIQKLREDGSPHAVIGRPGRVGTGALHYPTGVTVTPQRVLIVADAYNYALQWFDLEGTPIRRAGYHLFWVWPRPVSSSAGFAVPTDAAVGPDGLIHVADSGNHRIVMLSPSGSYMAEWRIADADPNIHSPEHLAVSADGSTVYATDLAGDRVLVLRVTPPSQVSR